MTEQPKIVNELKNMEYEPLLPVEKSSLPRASFWESYC